MQRRGITLGPIFIKWSLIESKAWRKKVKKFQPEKITTGRDTTKNVEGGQIPSPALLGLNYKFKLSSFILHYPMVCKDTPS